MSKLSPVYLSKWDVYACAKAIAKLRHINVVRVDVGFRRRNMAHGGLVMQRNSTIIMGLLLCSHNDGRANKSAWVLRRNRLHQCLTAYVNAPLWIRLNYLHTYTCVHMCCDVVNVTLLLLIGTDDDVVFRMPKVLVFSALMLFRYFSFDATTLLNVIVLLSRLASKLRTILKRHFFAEIFRI